LGANIKISSDSKQFITEMKEVTSNLKLVSSNLDVSSEKAKLFGSETDKLKTQHTQLSNNLKSNTTLLGLQNKTVSALATDIQKYRDRNTELAKSISSVEDRLKQQIKLTGEDSKETKALQKELETLQKEYSANEKAMSRAESQMNNYKIKANETEKVIIQNTKALQDLDTKISTVKIDAFSQKTGEMADKLKGASVAIGGLGVASAKLSMEFDDSIAKVSTISDDAEVPIEDLRKSILNLSNDTGIASTEIANNVYDAISAGQQTGDAVNFVTNSTKLAKAGFAEAGQSLDILTTIMNAYKLKSDEVVDVSDLLIQVQNKGKVTVGQLSADMGKVIPTASALGVNLSQLGASYAIMTSNGIKSAETTTYLNSMLNELGKSGSVSDKVLKEMTGQSFSQLTASGKSVGDVLKLLSDNASTGGKSLSDMFGSAEAGKAALVLSQNAGNDYNNMLQQMQNSAGATDLAFEKVNNTSGQRLKESLNEGKNAMIQFGDTASPLIEGFVGGISNITSWLNNMDEGSRKVVLGLGGFVVASGLGLGAVSKLSSGISDGIKLFDGLKNSTLLAEGATKLMSIAQGALNFVMNMNPISKVILVISLLAGAFVLAYNKVDWFRNMVNGAFEGIKNTISTVWNLVKNFSFPKIKLPHFSVQGEFSLVPPRMPKIGVEWYKNGGIMTSPTMFGMNGNNAMIGGEAGAEAILPLQQLWNQMDKNFDRLSERLNVNNNNKPIYVTVVSELDGKQVGRGIAKYVDEEINYLKI